MNYEWNIIKANDNDLVEKLNSLDEGWEVFSVVPTLVFDKKIMGTPIPSGVEHNIIVRKLKTNKN